MARSLGGTNARQPINQLKIGSRSGVASARAYSHEMIFSANIFCDVMPFGIGRHQAVINSGRHLEKAIDRAPSELDLERAQMPAIADAGDIAGDDRCALDPRANGVLWSSSRNPDCKDGQDKENWGVSDLHRNPYFKETVNEVEKICGIVLRIFAVHVLSEPPRNGKWCNEPDSKSWQPAPGRLHGNEFSAPGNPSRDRLATS